MSTGSSCGRTGSNGTSDTCGTDCVSPCWGSTLLGTGNPGLTPWAIPCRPFGAKTKPSSDRVARRPGLRFSRWVRTTPRSPEERPMTAPTDRRTADIRAKVLASERLSFDDGLHLEHHADLFTLGELANFVREQKNGNVTYYNVNQHLNPTNVCVYRCTFCSFRADLKSPKGYVMSDEQIIGRAREATEQGATELHIVGGLHHQLPYEWYLGIIRTIHRAIPEHHLKAWTAT